MNYNDCNGWNGYAGTYEGTYYAGDAGFARTAAASGNCAAAATAAAVYSEFHDSVVNSGRTPLTVSLKEQDGYYEIDYEAFEEAAKRRPRYRNNRCIFLSNRGNRLYPVGT